MFVRRRDGDAKKRTREARAGLVKTYGPFPFKTLEAAK
jgi:hypothetical protein